MWYLVEHRRRGDDPSFVLVGYAAPEGCDVADEDAWHAANPALGDFLYLDALRATPAGHGEDLVDPGVLFDEELRTAYDYVFERRREQWACFRRSLADGTL
jgi:hypothetical protein